jgi:hypothetical protein
MNNTRKFAFGAAIIGATLTGGAVGVSLLGGAANAQTPVTTVPASATPATGSSTGVDTSNSDATHEAGESAQREADETAGIVGGGKHGPSNTDPAHEAAESPQRAAEEAANDAAIANGTASSASSSGSSTTTG